MEQFSLSDRIALVTGGASGIGLAAAQRFLEAGARVVIGGARDRGYIVIDQIHDANVSSQHSPRMAFI